MNEAVRDHARRRLEPRQQDRQLAHRAAGLRRPPATLQPRLPRRREHPGLALRGRGGRRGLRARLAEDHGGQPVPGGHGPGLLPPVRDRLQPGAARRGGRDQLGRALPRRRGDPAGLDGDGRRGRRPASACSSSAPARPGCRPRTTWHGSATRSTIRDAGPHAGGMMRFGIPRYRLPRDVLDAEIAADRRPRRDARARRRRSTTSSTRCATERFDAVFLAVGAHIGKRAYVPAGEAARILDAVTVLALDGGRGAAAARPSRRRLRRRQHRDGRGPHGTAARRDGRRRGLPPHPRPDAGPRLRGRGGRGGGRPDEVALDRSSVPSRASLTIERMELDETGFPQPTGEFEELEADALVLALGQESDLALLDGVPGIEVSDGVVRVGPNLMTGHPGIFAGGDMVPAERTVTVAVGHGKKAARHIDAWLRGDASEAGSQARRLPSSTSSTRGTTRTRRARCSRPSSWRGGARRSRRSSRGSTRRPRSTRRAAAFPAATASTATTASASARTTPSSSWRAGIARQPGAGTRSTTTSARAAGSAPPSARAARSRWCPRQSEQLGRLQRLCELVLRHRRAPLDARLSRALLELRLAQFGERAVAIARPLSVPAVRLDARA